MLKQGQTARDIHNSRDVEGLSPNRISTRTGEIWLGGDGVVRVISRNTDRQTLADAKENIAAIGKVATGRRRPCLVDITVAGPQDQDCQAYYTGVEAGTHVTAVALVTNSFLGRIIGNVLVGMSANTAPVPYKLFTTHESALQWLRDYLS